MLRVVITILWFALLSSTTSAEGRFALLIGNQSYRENVGPLRNPHRDIALVGAALERVGFKVTTLKDAGYKAIDTAVKSHIQTVRRAGKQTISFVYYAGHGASDPDTKINYLIPVDVDLADDTTIWTNSLELNDLVNKLRLQSPDAIHYVVFDACRDELHLTRQGKKAVGSEKGFVAVGNISGVMVAYATAPGRTASDGGEDGGVYAKVLSDEIVKPDIEAVTMFRNVQLRVKQAIGQDPWLSFPTLPAVYFGGTKAASLTQEQQVELEFWLSVKDSTSPAALATYLKRYPNGEFAAIAGALAEHYDRKLKAEQATEEEERKRIEEERKAAEVKRLEEERRARETAIADERERTEKDKGIEEARRLEDQQRAELVKHTEEILKALEEARRAREAANAAEEQRIAAVKAADEATKAAEEVIASKRETETATGHPIKVAALPKIEGAQGQSGFDGVWTFVRSSSERCPARFATFTVTIANGVVTGPGGKGSISPAGKIWVPGKGNNFSGFLRGTSGSGTYTGRCTGTFTARHN